MGKPDLAIGRNPDPFVVGTAMPLRVVKRLQQFARMPAWVTEKS